jgi:hypothetical protein
VNHPPTDNRSIACFKGDSEWSRRRATRERRDKCTSLTHTKRVVTSPIGRGDFRSTYETFWRLFGDHQQRNSIAPARDSQSKGASILPNSLTLSRTPFRTELMMMNFQNLSLFLPANALGNESVKPESCWNPFSDVLMNDVDAFSTF